jgi:dihydrolipoamide dehydrogenase
MADETYDVAVIGGGPGGYVAAIAAAQAGMRTVCIESRDTLGGTCLNVGCIPSKTLLHWSERYHEAEHDFAKNGIKVGKLELDLKAMLANKTKVVDTFTAGIGFLFKKNKVDHLVGKGTLTGANAIDIALNDGGNTSIAAKNIIIATGSVPADIPNVTVDEKRIVSSTGALEFTSVPKSLVIIGGGYIGLELGSVWRRLGSEVTVVEFLDRLVPTMDSELAKQYSRLLKKQGFTFKLGTKVSEAKATAKGVTLTLEPAAGGKAEKMTADAVLVSVGRKPFTEGLGLEATGVALDARGHVTVDDRFRTNLANVYAIGDVIPGPMLAHKAMSEALAVVEIIGGSHGLVNYDVIPAVVYTDPEVAWVGRTEDELKDAGIEYKSGSFPFTANSRAKTVGHTDGLAKVLTDAKTDRLLGVHIMSIEAGSLIAEAAMAMEFGGSAEDIARTCHAHPTLSEAVMEAASVAAFGKAIHM